MSQKLINLNEDLKKLRNEGFNIEVRNAYLLVHEIPYVNSQKEIKLGMLATVLDLSGDKTVRPQSHVIRFAGEYPCDKDGNIIKEIQSSSGKETIAEGIEVDHLFSSKPDRGYYDDYYEKISTYAAIIYSHAQAIDSSVKVKPFRVIESADPDCVFNYIDTNSSKAEIDILSDKFKNLKIAIIGLGGTGSYILDFVSKTPVREIHLFDEDVFLSHNAFRAPGAASIEELRDQPKKVKYLHNIYSKMHKYIIPHEYNINSSNLEELAGINFVFICLDNGISKQLIIEKLLKDSIPFIDVGIWIELVNGLLTGSVRVTSLTAEKNDHLNNRISFEDVVDDDYDKNIQIADMNALNATLAIIKWKKMVGFYHDLEKEHHMIYNINNNQLVNDENIS